MKKLEITRQEAKLITYNARKKMKEEQLKPNMGWIYKMIKDRAEQGFFNVSKVHLGGYTLIEKGLIKEVLRSKGFNVTNYSVNAVSISWQ